MNISSNSTLFIVGAIATLVIAPPLHAQISSTAAPPAASHIVKGTPNVKRAAGTFEVKLAPLDAYNKTEGANAGRMSLDKVFKGDLEATGKGEMLTAGTDVKGSAAYVAIERVTGTLQGRSGSFALHHTGVMNRGTPSLSIAVVPDSGTGQLAGISGKLNIIIAGGKHSYEFDYSLPDTP